MNLLKVKRVLLLTTVMIIGATAWLRWSQPEFRRPFEGDELATILEFTLVGITPSGQQYSPHQIEDLYSFPRPSMRHLALGLYCSLGRWTSPNNHVVNSLFMNLAVVAGNPDEGTFRLPALSGAILLALLLIPLVIRSVGSWVVLPIVIIIALWHPYVSHYSLTARGYTWMLALQFTSLLTLTFLQERPSSILWGAVLAAVSILSLMNVVSLSLDWVVPLYLTAYFVSAGTGSATEGGVGRDQHRSLLRKNLLVQCLCIGAVGLTFLADRLPVVVMSSQRYGLHFQTPHELFEHLAEIVDTLFPGIAWKLVGVVGLVGLLVTGQSAQVRWLRALAATTALVVLGHVLLTKTLPYARACGFILPFVFLGVANITRLAIEWSGTTVRRSALWSVLLLGSICLAWASSDSTATGIEIDADSHDLARAARQMAGDPEVARMALCDPHDLATLELYLPADWLHSQDRLPVDRAVELELLVDEEGRKFALETDSATHPRSWESGGWCDSRAIQTFGQWRLITIPGETHGFSDLASRPPSDGRALVFWYPHIKSYAVPPYPVPEFVKASGLGHLLRYVRLQIRMLSATFLDCVVLIAESPAEYESAAQLVTSGIERFGGDAVVFVPR